MPSRPGLPRDHPRRRLVDVGPRALSDRELVALLAGPGRSAVAALEVADRLLTASGGDLRAISRLSPVAFERVPGVGGAVAARLVAALELGRRAATGSAPGRTRVRGPADVFRRVGPSLRDLQQEEFHAVLLDAQHRIVRVEPITRGILDASLIHPREVFRPAVVHGAAALIVVHNHPSGDPTPSREDRAVTRQLARAGEAIGIPVLDHLVVGDGRYHAFSDEGPLG